jgi:hypothetical protein
MAHCVINCSIRPPRNPNLVIHPGLALPNGPHLVKSLRSMRMQVEFYNLLPDL